jgi:predicted phosphodiesterase
MSNFPIDVERIAFVGDIHANTRYMETVLTLAAQEAADVVVQVGDFGYNFLDDFLNKIDEVSKHVGIPVLFVDGNHENFDRLYSFPVSSDGVRRLRKNVLHLPRGFRWEWQGIRFLALGGAHSVDRSWRTPFIEWWPQEQISLGEALYASGQQSDVMITHDCPDNVDIPLSSGSWIPEVDVHSANNHRKLLGWVVDEVQPKHLIHGHYHVRYTGKRGDTVVNGLGMAGQPLEESMMVVNTKDLVK